MKNECQLKKYISNKTKKTKQYNKCSATEKLKIEVNIRKMETEEYENRK